MGEVKLEEKKRDFDKLRVTNNLLKGFLSGRGFELIETGWDGVDGEAKHDGVFEIRGKDKALRVTIDIKDVKEEK